MNATFVFVLKSDRCVDVCQQNRQLSFLIKRDKKIANVYFVKMHERSMQLFKKYDLIILINLHSFIKHCCVASYMPF